MALEGLWISMEKAGKGSVMNHINPIREQAVKRINQKHGFPEPVAKPSGLKPLKKTESEDFVKKCAEFYLEQGRYATLKNLKERGLLYD